MLKFSIPCVLSMLVGALYNIIDQIFIGNSSIGTIGITATSVVFPMITIAMAFGLMLGDGATAYLSLCMGKRESDKIGKAIGSAITIAAGIGVIFWIAGYSALDRILNFLGAKTAESMATSHEYAFWILLGLPFTILGTSLTPIVRADGAPKVAMASGLSGCLLNIVLDWLFIFPMHMDVAGAAIATTIGNIVSFLIVFQYLFHTKSFQLKASDFVPDLPVIGQIGKLGFSSFLTQLSIVIITIVSMNMLAKYGAQSKYGANDPQAIIGMVMKVFTIAVNLAVGISAGCQPIFGFNYGAGRYDRVRKLLAWSCGACCASASLQQFYSRRSRRRSSAFSGQIHRTRRSIWNLAQGRCASICC
ncbi:MAG: MATE family efflux transporter [Oscillospiraceae bacterium]